MGKWIDDLLRVVIEHVVMGTKKILDAVRNYYIDTLSQKRVGVRRPVVLRICHIHRCIMHLIHQGLIYEVSIANLAFQYIKLALILIGNTDARQVLCLVCSLSQTWKQTGIFKRSGQGIVWICKQLLLLVELYAGYIFRLAQHDFMCEVIDIFESASIFSISPWNPALTQFVLKSCSHLTHTYTSNPCWWRINIDSHN